jgi:hypothetical protein
VLNESYNVEIYVEDPTSGERFRFTGGTEAEAIRAAEIFFGVDEAEAVSDSRDVVLPTRNQVGGQ